MRMCVCVHSHKNAQYYLCLDVSTPAPIFVSSASKEADIERSKLLEVIIIIKTIILLLMAD